MAQILAISFLALIIAGVAKMVFDVQMAKLKRMLLSGYNAIARSGGENTIQRIVGTVLSSNASNQ